MRSFLMVFLTLGVILMPFSMGAAHAQPDIRLYDSLNFLNKTKPLQNPRFDRMKDVLNNHVLDNGNRVIGDVNDILLNKNGDIAALNTELNRLHIRGDVFLSFSEMRIRTVSNAYTLNIADDQLEELLPALLNNIETAAGNENVFSLRKIDGARLVAEDGRRLGKVLDVLFSNSGARAQALYVDLNFKSVRGEQIAVPFSIARFVPKARSFDVVLSNAQADAVLEYVRER